MKKKYTKPAFKAIDIQVNDLCVGSQQGTSIPIHIMKMKSDRVKYKHSFKNGETCDMWETGF